MTRFLVLFLTMLLVLFSLEILNFSQQNIILPFTSFLADVSTSIVTLFDADVTSYENVIASNSNGFAVRIEAGCNGVEAMIILFCAIMAFPATLKYKAVGLGIGFVAIQALNLVRIISLFYLGQWSLTAFKWFHLYLWQALIILDALVVWLVWLKYMPRRDGNKLAAPA